MSQIKIEFVTATIEMAKASTCSKRHAALVVRGNRVIGAGINIMKTHPGTGRRASYHAEFSALRRLKRDPSKPLEMPAKGAILYSFRNGFDKRSRPCSDCIQLAKEKGIKMIVFSYGSRDPEDWNTDMDFVFSERL